MEAFLQAWWPFHWIDLTLWEWDGDSFLFELLPDGSTDITANFKGIKGIGDPEEHFIIDRRICKIGYECIGRGGFLDFLMFFSSGY